MPDMADLPYLDPEFETGSWGAVDDMTENEVTDATL
jgi:hypothetical protein